jgi:hypothetical protein
MTLSSIIHTPTCDPVSKDSRLVANRNVTKTEQSVRLNQIEIVHRETVDPPLSSLLTFVGAAPPYWSTQTKIPISKVCDFGTFCSAASLAAGVVVNYLHPFIPPLPRAITSVALPFLKTAMWLSGIVPATSWPRAMAAASTVATFAVVKQFLKRNVDSTITYCPHMLSNLVNESSKVAIHSEEAPVLRQRLRRLATIPVSDSIHTEVVTGTEDAYLALQQDFQSPNLKNVAKESLRTAFVLVRLGYRLLLALCQSISRL